MFFFLRYRYLVDSKVFNFEVLLFILQENDVKYVFDVNCIEIYFFGYWINRSNFKLDCSNIIFSFFYMIKVIFYKI